MQLHFILMQTLYTSRQESAFALLQELCSCTTTAGCCWWGKGPGLYLTSLTQEHSRSTNLTFFCWCGVIQLHFLVPWYLVAKATRKPQTNLMNFSKYSSVFAFPLPENSDIKIIRSPLTSREQSPKQQVTHVASNVMKTSESFGEEFQQLSSYSDADY